MLFRRDVLDGIRSGQVTRAFRHWRKPTVKPGGRLRTAAGELAIERVEAISDGDITAADARHAGFAALDDLRADLKRQRDGTLYRIVFRLDGADRRIALRQSAKLDEGDRTAIAGRLDRMDRGTAGAWTRPVLALIGRKPGTRAADLADELGEADLAAFKTRVRKLKELGLTESLEVGYRLSPRGRAFLGLRMD